MPYYVFRLVPTGLGRNDGGDCLGGRFGVECSYGSGAGQDGARDNLTACGPPPAPWGQEGGGVKVEGTWGSFARLLAAHISRATSRPILYICPHIDDADKAADDLRTFGAQKVETLPADGAVTSYEPYHSLRTGIKYRASPLVSPAICSWRARP